MPKKSNTKSKSRRANNEGSVYQRSDGRWCAQITVGYQENGKPDRKTIYGKDQQELLRKMKAMSLNILENGYETKVRSNMLFEEAYMEWLMNFKKPSVVSRTFESYIFRAKKHVLKNGRKSVGSILSIDIQTVLNEMRHLSLDMRLKVYQDHDQFFRFAVAEGIVKVNPMKNVVKPKNVRKEHLDDEEDYMAIPSEDRPKVLAALNESRFFYLKPMLLTMMFAGLRIGELIALKWKHISFEKETIAVEGAVNRITEFDDNGNILGRTTQISDTKTACSIRIVPVNQFLLGILSNWLRYQRTQEEVLNLKLTDKNSVVFPTVTGTRRQYAGVRSAIVRFNTRCGFARYHAHTYRHTFATMLFEQNVNPKIVQKLMGHRDIKTTLKIYNSINRDSLADSVKLIEVDFISPPAVPQPVQISV